MFNHARNMIPQTTNQLFISLARMHHISNPSKYRQLKRIAMQSQVSGFVKTGKPGVLVFDGERDSIKIFLERVRGLRYLDFHSVDTKFIPDDKESLAPGQHGLQEVTDMNELISRVNRIGEKEWFRSQMRMSKGAGGT